VALEWPGWARSGRDEAQAVQTLFDYAPRYARVVKGLGFKAPESVDELVVRERLHGDASTDMGSLTGDEPAFDAQPVDKRGHQRLIKFLEASWRMFDQTVADVKGKQLRTGPRGGGRTLDKIVQHVLDAEGGYLRRLDYKREKAAEQDLELTRKAMLEALAASVRGEVAEYGPRGGKRWTARYFVRREVWHLVDHAWEIEDRAL
jgi:hypothetical protein